MRRCLTHVEMSSVHICSLAHVQEVLYSCVIYNNIYCYFLFKSNLYEVLKNVDVCENIHYHRNHLQNKKTQMHMLANPMLKV